jgi:hypothetical protein
MSIYPTARHRPAVTACPRPSPKRQLGDQPERLFHQYGTPGVAFACGQEMPCLSRCPGRSELCSRLACPCNELHCGQHNRYAIQDQLADQGSTSHLSAESSCLFAVRSARWTRRAPRRPRDVRAASESHQRWSASSPRSLQLAHPDRAPAVQQ